jgi:hypothetical protein
MPETALKGKPELEFERAATSHVQRESLVLLLMEQIQIF